MENKHDKHTLKQFQSLPLDAKIRMTQERIKAWYEYWDENGGYVHKFLWWQRLHRFKIHH